MIEKIKELKELLETALGGDVEKSIEFHKKYNNVWNPFDDGFTEMLHACMYDTKCTGSAGLGWDNLDKGESKYSSRVQSRNCKNCGSKVMFFIDTCQDCGSKDLKSPKDSRWGISSKAHLEYYDSLKGYRLALLEPIEDDANCREFVLSSRIAKICADLLSAKKIRLYHDNALVKESGCGRTPWHYDDHHFPLETNDVITAWIPAQAIPIEMGPLMFAKPIEVYKLVKDIEFNESDTSYDKKISDIFKKQEVSIVEEPFELGEVSFHHNLSFHTASENKTTQSRIVLANTYFADGARVVNNPTMISGDWKKFIPETKPGQIVSSKFNPVCWPAINQI